MMRDHWWWPWWVSSLIDIGVVLVAFAIFRRSSRRLVRIVAGVATIASPAGGPFRVETDPPPCAG